MWLQTGAKTFSPPVFALHVDLAAAGDEGEGSVTTDALTESIHRNGGDQTW